MAAHERAGTDHVLVIGDVMVDVVVVPAGPLRHGSDVPSRIRVTGGGSAANTACWLASLGRPVCLAAMVGDDPTGTGVPTSVDAASAAPLRAVGPERFLDWVDGCGILFANDDELAALGGPGPCLGRVRVVVAKHGPAGSSWLEPDRELTCPATPVLMVDTVGAGDAFDAGVIDACLSGADPSAALAAASVVAARAVVTPGARPLG